MLFPANKEYCGECQEYYKQHLEECPSCKKTKIHNEKLRIRYKDKSIDEIKILMSKIDKNKNSKSFYKYLDLKLVISWKEKELNVK